MPCLPHPNPNPTPTTLPPPPCHSGLQVPWSSLGTVPVEAKIDRLYLLASPKTEEERGKGVRREVRLGQAGHMTWCT